MITITGTKVDLGVEELDLFELNNLVDTLTAVTDKEAGWEYNLDIYMPITKRYNSIIMTRNGQNLTVTLTREMLPTNGRYICQFRGQYQDSTYHTEKFEVWVKDSIDMNDGYNPMPAEFYQMEAHMKNLLEQAQEAMGDVLPPISEQTANKYLSNNGTDVEWTDIVLPDTGITEEEADERYLQLTGGTMSGNIDMGGNQIRGVRSIVANGSTGNAGVQFASNGNFTNIVCGVSTSASFSANAVDFYNHNLDRVNSINMTSEATIEDTNYIGGNVEQNNRTCIDFTTENQVGVWAKGEQKIIVSDDNIDVNNNIISNVATPVAPTDAANKTFVEQAILEAEFQSGSGITIEQADTRYLRLSGGTLSGPLNMGTNKITMGGTPTEIIDVTNKGYVDGVVEVVSNEVDKILDGTSPVALPIASETHLGGIKIGSGMSIEEDGTVNIVQAQQSLPTASATQLGCVKVGTGLIIEQDGSLEATAGLYRDDASGIVFVGPNSSKTMRLPQAYQVLYGTEFGISEDALDPSWGGPFYINASQSETIGNLQVSFNENGAEFTITNSHDSVCYFFMYGGYSLPTT